MASSALNYDPLAPAYHGRYAVNPLPGTAAALHGLVQSLAARRVLEVGCGTGRWLDELKGEAAMVGLDFSPGMLARARAEGPGLCLVRGTAACLPCRAAAFDLVLCVNAFHHLPEPRAFVAEARRLLRPGGGLAVVGLDPHAGRDRWYLYDYFAGTREADLTRFTACEVISDWMAAAGLRVDGWKAVEHIQHSYAGREVLDDYFLDKASTSQLALLTDGAYAAGRERIGAALAEAERARRPIMFETDLALVMVTERLV